MRGEAAATHRILTFKRHTFILLTFILSTIFLPHAQVERMMADLRMQEMFLVQREEETNCHANALQLRQVKLVEARLAVQLKNKVVQARAREMDEVEAEHEEEVSSYRDEVNRSRSSSARWQQHLTALTAHHSRHSPLTTCHSPLTTHHSPLTTSPPIPPSPPHRSR